jgi:valyl-tRNA synthetase
MTQPKHYDPKEVEHKWLEFWEAHKIYEADPMSSKPAWSISMPPPNVTGQLHMGHALGQTLQDVMTRFKRMQGYEVLYVPGTDHAGIATQTSVERHLIKTEGKTRKEYKREEFLEHVWQWKRLHENRINSQVKRLGISCDWSKARFTMDEGCNLAVRTLFKKMYDEGLIYRGDYLVNWDPITQTALADDEVEYEEKEGSLWHFRYPLEDGTGSIQIATTRPETMLGDTAIAVHPHDERYKKLIGKNVILPIVGRKIPIIADRLVDPAFGTGAVKITPAHDPNDYQMGLTHDLPFINIMTPDGKINENGEPFKGLTMEQARKAVVQEMEKLGYLVKIEKHLHRVGVSYRSKAVIEPYLSKQWFVNMQGFKETLKKAVADQHVELVPSNWKLTYNHWIDNLRDWCISRQLWWGHRIPVWYNKENQENVICYAGEGVPPEVAENPDLWEQDEDVLDTWFSSALWPFSILGWPENSSLLQKFYPNSLLVTGHDILFFWVARMILMGLYTQNEVPFPKVFLHGLIYGKSYWRVDQNGTVHYCEEKERISYDLGEKVPSDVKSRWEKMSKSKGNVIDPLEICDLYGTDACRMALCASATQSREIDLDRRKFEEFKNFANKIWNGARFIFLNLEGDSPLTAEEFSLGLQEDLFHLEDRWILSQVNRTVQSVTKLLEEFSFDQAALQAYDFFWKEFCSYYLEIAKPVLFGKEGTKEERKNKQKILGIVLCKALRLLHPMAPFITEELFSLLKERFKGVFLSEKQDAYTQDCIKALQNLSISLASYPKVVKEEHINKQVEQAFDFISSFVYQIRNMRGEMKLPPGISTDLYIIIDKQDERKTLLINNSKIIRALVQVGKMHMQEEEPKLSFCSTSIVEGIKILIPLPQELVEQEKMRLGKELNKLSFQIDKLAVQLQNEEYLSKAPAQLIQKQRDQLTTAQEQKSQIEKKLSLYS